MGHKTTCDTFSAAVTAEMGPDTIENYNERGVFAEKSCKSLWSLFLVQQKSVIEREMDEKQIEKEKAEAETKAALAEEAARKAEAAAKMKAETAKRAAKVKAEADAKAEK